MGYLRQPHLSAGRVPTEEGYRLFVGNIVQESRAPRIHPADDQLTSSTRCARMWNNGRGWQPPSWRINHAAASLVTAPHPDQASFKHLELIASRGRQVLMVLVLMGGEILQRFITLAEPVSQEQLSQFGGNV